MRIVLKTNRPDEGRGTNKRIAEDLVDKFEVGLEKAERLLVDQGKLDGFDFERVTEYAIQMLAEQLHEVAHTHGGKVSDQAIQIKQ